MAKGTLTTSDLQELDTFDRANTPLGLLLRYANGRVRTLWFRLFVIFCGVVLTAAYTNYLYASVVLVAMATFEITEFSILKRLIGRPYQQLRMARISPIVTIASSLQATTIGVSIAIIGIQNDAARLVAWVFLIGVTLNSLLVARYHPSSHHVRVVAYLASVMVILLHQAFVLKIGIESLLTQFIAASLMVYMLISLFRHLTRREIKMLAAERGMIEQGQAARLSNIMLEKSQKELTAKERIARRLALVAEHATDSVILTDKFATVLWVNPQFTRITGYSFKNAVGRPIADLLDGPLTDQASSDKIVQARQQLKPVQETILNYCKDGSTVWMQVSQTPVFDDDGQFRMFISVERDATKSIQKQEELQAALEAAKLADKEKSDFLARMSHELRTPANGIVGGAELLGETPLSNDQQEMLEILKQGADRMQAIVEDILDFCELTKNSLPPQNQALDLGNLIEDIANSFKAEAKAKGLLGPYVHLPQPVYDQVFSDPLLLRRIFKALIGNAVKFTQKGRIDVTLHIIQRKSRMAIEVEVRDTGIGIPQSEHNRIFNKFTQVDGKRTRKFDGAGLGLAIAQASAHLLGGDIFLDKNMKSGTCFTVSLCLQSASSMLNPLVPNSLKNPDLTLLVAEDNRTNRLLISKMFKETQLQLEFAEDGVQAVEKYSELRPDLVLMDIAMPHKDGLQATREIRLFEQEQQLPACPILALTANTFESDRKDCFEAGMNDFLAKPVRKKSLMAAVKTALKFRDGDTTVRR